MDPVYCVLIHNSNFQMQADSLYDEFDDCCDLSYIVDSDIPRGYYDNKTASYEA